VSETGDTIYAYANSLGYQHANIKSLLRSKIPGIEIIRDFRSLFNGMAIKVPQQYVSRLNEIPGIINVYNDEPVYPDIDDTIPMLNADDAWLETNATGHTITGKDVLVSIIDSGIDYTHPDLGNGFGPGFRVIGGYDYINSDNDPIDDWWHGTHVAGIVGANGTKVGVAPDVEFLAYKVFGYGGSGGTWSNIIAAMEASADPDGDPGTEDGADVISMSLGGGGDPDSPVSQAADNAFDSGIIVVTSAGNSGPGNWTVGAPANARSAIAVGSVMKSDSLISSSSRGPSSFVTIKPNILAPGVSIESTMPGGGYSSKSGTSMAAPHVSGTAALVIQAHRDWDQNVTRAAIVNTAIDLDYYVNWQGTGRVDAYESVMAEAAIIPDGVSFNLVDLKNEMWYREKTLNMVNTQGSSSGYDLTIDMQSYPGVSVTLNISHIDLAAYQNALFELNVSLNTSLAQEHWYEGRIVANSTTENISVPFFFIRENLTVIATPNPSNGETDIKVNSLVDLLSIEVKIELPDSSKQDIPMSGWGKEWTGTFTVTQNGLHTINASSTDENDKNNTGSTTLMGDLTPPDFFVTASPDPADYFTNINVTSNENISGVWFPDERITKNDWQESMYPEIAVDSNDILHMVWEDDEGDTKNSVFYKRMENGTWKNKQIISDSTFNGRGARGAKFVVDSNDFVHVIFRESTTNWYARLYYCKINGSTGTVVIPYMNITTTSSVLTDEQFVLDMAFDSQNNIHAIGNFYVEGVYASYIILNDTGTLLDYNETLKTRNIVIDSSGDIHILYVEDDEIYYYRYDNGSQYGFKKLTDSTGGHYGSEIAVDDKGNIHIVWRKYQEGIFYVKYDFISSTWGTKTQLTDFGRTPKLSLEDSGNLHLAFCGTPGGTYYKKFNAITASWEQPIKLSSSDAYSNAIAIDLDSNFIIYVAWYDYRDNDNEEVYLARYRSSPYYSVQQPDGTNISLSMSLLSADGMNFTSIFYPTQDGTHYVNATGFDMAGNVYYNTTSFEALIPPFVSNPNPGNNSYTTDRTPNITATLWDYSGVDVNSVIILVNGTNVTGSAVITSTSVSYTPISDLWIGPVNVSILCSDIFGNAMKVAYNWTFFIDLEPPSPTGLTLDLSDDDIVLSWTAPSSPDNNHYLIYKSSTPEGFNYSNPYHNTSLDANPLATTWTDVDAASNWMMRYYVVRVVDNNGINDSNQNKASNGDWVVVGIQSHSNLDIVLNGNLSIKSGGILTLDNFTLQMNSTSFLALDITVGISFTSKGNLTIRNNSKITSASSYDYNITVENFANCIIRDSTVEAGDIFQWEFNSLGSVINCTLDDFSWIRFYGDLDLIANNTISNIGTIYIIRSPKVQNNTIFDCGTFQTAGGFTTKPYIANNTFTNLDYVILSYGSEPTLYNNTVSSGNTFGIYILESNPIIEKATLTDNDPAFYVRGGSLPVISNSTITGIGTHFRLKDDAHPVTINTTFDHGSVDFDDATCSLTIKWFMHVYVEDNVGVLVAGATVDVINVSGGALQTGLTDLDGFARWFLCIEEVMYSALTTSHTPHNVTATKGGVTGYANPEPIMDASKVVVITLDIDFPPTPPTDLSIEISAGDIVLEWTPSPSSDLSHYLIYRSDSPQNIDYGIPWINTSIDSDNGITPIRTTWNDTGAASLGFNLFYVVRAVDSASQNDSNTFSVGIYFIKLLKDWNMISIPLSQDDTSLSTVLASIAGDYNIAQYFNSTQNKWIDTSSGLSDVDHTMALWIHMKTPADLVVIGKVPQSTSIQLTTSGDGWNFIGYPCFRDRTPADVLSSISGSYDALQVYNSSDLNDPWKHYDIDKPTALNDLEYMNPGFGYWIHVSSPCILTVDD
jgi:parallel beta-helix repeat protein